MKYIVIWFLLKSTGTGRLDKFLEQNSKVFYNRDSAFNLYKKVLLTSHTAKIDSIKISKWK